MNKAKMPNWQTQQRLFVALLLIIFILLGVLSVRYDKFWDLTSSQRNKLSETSVKVVKQLQAPLAVTAFTRGNPQVKTLVQRVLNKYRDYVDIELTYRNPDTAIDAVRDYDISRDGELLLHYQGQTAHASALDETAITRAIYALLQSQERYVFMTVGHGERQLNDDNGGYGQLKKLLAEQRIALLPLDLANLSKLPDNTDSLIIADAKLPLQAKEVALIASYLQHGGRLLWLSEADNAPQAQLVKLLGVAPKQAVLINQSGKKYDFNQPDYTVIEPQSTFVPLKDIDTFLLFAQASPLTRLPTSVSEAWQAVSFLPAPANSYIKSEATITKPQAPQTLGLALLPTAMQKKQKVVLLGDSDWLSNQFIGVGQNADFAINLLQYLSTADSSFIRIDHAAPKAVVISEKTLAYWALAVIVGVPLLILSIGHYHRRRQRRKYRYDD